MIIDNHWAYLPKAHYRDYVKMVVWKFVSQASMAMFAFGEELLLQSYPRRVDFHAMNLLLHTFGSR